MILRKYLIDFGNLTEVVMAFDFKKEYKEFYMPKNKPAIVTVPKQIILQSEERVIQTKKAVHINKRLVFYMLLHTH